MVSEGAQVADRGDVDWRQERRPQAGRPERPLDVTDGPLSRFAHELRQLRAAAGYPSYRVLARTALFSASVLSTAASGAAFPSLPVTLAYAGACGADTAEWRSRWEAVAAELGQPRADRAVAARPDPRTCPRPRSGRFGCRTRRPSRPWMRPG